MEAETKLAKCPFCGNDSKDELGICKSMRSLPEVEGIEFQYLVYNVVCSCGATGPDGESREEAAERWNKRAEGV